MPIYDLSYRRIEGIRRAQPARFLPITSLGIRHYFKKKANLVLVLIGLIPYIVFTVVILLPYLFSDSGVTQNLPPEIMRLLHVTPDSANLMLSTATYWFVLLIAIGSGSGAITNDLASNALEIYFSRPIHRFDYLLGKFGSIFALTSLVSLVPLIVVSLLDVAVSPEPGYLRSQIPVIARVLAAQCVVLIPLALVVLAVSSLVRSQRNAVVVFIAFIIGLPILAEILREVTHEPHFQLLNYRSCVERVVYDVVGVADFGNSPFLQAASRALGEAIEVARQPMRNVESWKPAAVVVGWCLLAIAVLHRRVRGFEVVKG